MDPRCIGANLQALHANGSARRKPVTESEEDAYYRRHAPPKGRASMLIAIVGSLWRRAFSTEIGVGGTAETSNRPAAVGHSSHP
jgi:hypothetical protein